MFILEKRKKRLHQNECFNSVFTDHILKCYEELFSTGFGRTAMDDWEVINEHERMVNLPAERAEKITMATLAWHEWKSRYCV